MAKRLVPLLNRVLVEKIVPPSKTNAGILLPEKSTKLNSGKVVAVGPGVHDREGKLIPVSLKQGDTVLIPDYGGTEVKLGDKEYTLSCSLTLFPRKFLDMSYFKSCSFRKDQSIWLLNVADIFLASCRRQSGTIYIEMRIYWEHCMINGFE
ncbi:10 kDa chaperonin, mitochondrial isoform X1 [Ziziphus jujuba]|uniref:Protein groES n=2 Tax=Ziziphus jujuba TaxID=326968 RepID=A0A6P4B706_ZIZJJ|nr:10 kDa chaperonin, mitochondrial isoform X1 [Ziziphus jujuba]